MSRSTARTVRRRCTAAGLGLLLVSAGAHAQLVVPAGATIVLSGGVTDLACTDVIVDGTLDLASGTLINARHVQIGASGSLALGSGAVSLAGNWGNSGAFSAGTGSVSLVDDAACSPTSVISGNSTFHALNITSTTGKLVQFAAGSVQTVQSALTLTGTGTPLRLESTTPASVSADINLLTGGTQNLANLAVRGMSASGQWLAAGQTNQGPGPVSRWFGTPTPPGGIAPVPTLSQWALVGLALTLGALTARQRRPLKNKSTGRKS